MLQDNRIYTTLFRKGTATNNLLHYSSFHPGHLRNSIPKSQFLRLRRNCSQLPDFQVEARSLTNRLRERGYPRRIISSAFEYSRQKPREEALKPRVSPRSFFNCRTQNVVYALVCGCNKVYVGQTTQQLRRRIQQHISNISMARTDRDKDSTTGVDCLDSGDNQVSSPWFLMNNGIESALTLYNSGLL
ncbi:uncharacterized protein LOC143818042 [Ranitomeya variabilis]|uniref:uncharacterized protein LOC143818042 n=1 Tax=Ranitomeya variabilis TaxID=490064 RepID=UPI0040559E77